MERSNSLEPRVPMALSGNNDNDSSISPPDESKIPAPANKKRDEGNFGARGDCSDFSQK